MYDNNYLASRLRAATLGRDDAVFAEMLDQTIISYGEMFNLAERYAQTLITNGLKPGGRVTVQVEKSIESLQLYLAHL